MKAILFLVVLVAATRAYALGERAQESDLDDKKPEKLIIESEELCDPKEQTDMPRFY